MAHQMTRNSRSKKAMLKCGPKQIAGVFVAIVLVAMVINLRVATTHQQRTWLSIQEISPDATGTAPKRKKSRDSSHRQESQMQVVFSTSCSIKHDWQSYLFFFQAYLHQQPGNVTRIVSGCTEEQQQEMLRIHEEQISIMNERFHLHFTPEFGKIEGRSWEVTKYWNKPFGVKHWLENKFGYRYEGDVSTPFDDDIIVLVDPDMLMQRPFLNDFSKFPKTTWHKSIRNRDDLYFKVSHGKPIAQTYSFNDAWLLAARKGNMEDIVGPGSPALNVSNYDATVTFSAGPPYMLTARDMYRLVHHWAKFLPLINNNFVGMMGEMYGYCTAAAHLNLRHQIATGFMVSNVVISEGEGWDFMDHVTGDACDVAKFRDTAPLVVHFCQRYSVGEYFLSKYKVPTDILTCDHKLFELPPKDIAAYTTYSHYGDNSTKTYSGGKMKDLYRHTFMVCSIMDGLNRAATFYKDHHCPNGANYNATWNHFREEKLQGCKTVHDCPV